MSTERTEELATDISEQEVTDRLYADGEHTGPGAATRKAIKDDETFVFAVYAIKDPEKDGGLFVGMSVEEETVDPATAIEILLTSATKLAEIAGMDLGLLSGNSPDDLIDQLKAMGVREGNGGYL